MLVLSRKVGEQVVIQDNICVTVIAIDGQKVRLGFTAPEKVIIRREELGPTPKSQHSEHTLASHIPKRGHKPTNHP